MDTHETSLYRAVLIMCFSMAVIIGYFVYSLIRHHRVSVAGRREHYSKEIELLESQRSSLAMDLHDDIAVQVSAVRWHLDEMPTATTEGVAHKERASMLLAELIKRLGRICKNLKAPSLARKGLHEALERFVDGLKGAVALQIDFVYDVQSVIGDEAGGQLLRMVQEVTHNTIKHADARRLQVCFRQKKETLYLYCRDDGKGFDTRRTAPRQGIGLGNLRMRTELLNGTMRCISNQKHGTEYLFEFPLRAERAEDKSDHC